MYPETGRIAPSARPGYILDENHIPPVGSVPVRPLMYFYLGEPPIWYDVFSRKVHKTKYFDEVIERINSNRNVVALGLPACGKTTLLMQVAFEIEYDGQKGVFFESLTKEKAELIAKSLDGARAILFVDNFSDEIKSFQYLSKFTNIRLVGFDRDYNFEMAAHLLDIGNFDIIDVTEIQDERDIQEILLRIPAEIRTQNAESELRRQKNLSIFELIQINTRFPKLKARFGKVLAELQSESHYLLEMLVMSCYVHSCRTPVSRGMLYSFFRNDIIERSEIDKILEKLGSMIKEYMDMPSIGEREYGYFTPRSTYVSEAIIEQVKPEVLRDVLLKFYRQLSRYRICRYDVFQRKAYDSRLINRAFSDWIDGKCFYEIDLTPENCTIAN